MADDKQVPKYRLTETAFVDDKICVEDEEIDFEGIPGYHMVAINAAAKEMKKKHPSREMYSDPVEGMLIKQ
jgi:hypothetical protein